eukprot:1812136-Alexandrium_andersonii.AAC.1
MPRRAQGPATRRHQRGGRPSGSSSAGHPGASWWRGPRPRGPGAGPCCRGPAPSSIGKRRPSNPAAPQAGRGRDGR